MANQVPTKNSKAQKWTTQQIETLIDAYKDEACLYATNQPNYRNKHLRGEALVRVCKAVKHVRPTINAKECLVKFHTLRNQFNIEHSKVKASHKIGTKTDDIYRPNLWYYPKLLFLEPYITPRKNRNFLEKVDEELASQHQDFLSSITEDKSQLFEGSDLMHLINDEENIESKIEVENNSLNISSKQLQELGTALSPSSCTSTSDTPETGLAFIPPSPISPALLASSINASPSTSNFDFQQARPEFVPLGSLSPTLSIASTSGVSSVSQSRSNKKRRLNSCDDDYLGAMYEHTETMKRPITINTMEGIKNTSSLDPVDSFVNFIGSLLRSFQDEELKLEVMNNISQTVLNAKSTDIRRGKK